MSSSDNRPTMFCLHFLGGSARTWDGVTTRLNDAARIVPVDLPGFGDAAGKTGYSVTEMADHVAEIIAAAAPARWLLLGHSMGAKIAAVLARRAEDGAPGLAGLAGLVLVSGSPPAPEPMSEDRRQAMLGWFTGTLAARQAEADGYIKQAAGQPLAPDTHEAAIGDVMRTHRDAWRAWLSAGSREDWSARTGILQTPALIIAGTDDEDLGPDAQQRLMARHFANSIVVSLDETGHLAPLQRPAETARLIAGFINGAPAVDPAYQALIESDRVSSCTRTLLLRRMVPDRLDYQPRVMDAAALRTLRALVQRVLPQRGGAIDLAARIDTNLAEGVSDGWRFAVLPADAAAYQAGLRTLDAAAPRPFAELEPQEQDALLQSMADGGLEVAGSGLLAALKVAGQSLLGAVNIAGPGLLDARQMQLWFEDVRSDAVRLYVAHPATLSRMGYSGIGYGGDGEPKAGFHLVGPGEAEAWEPQAQGTAA